MGDNVPEHPVHSPAAQGGALLQQAQKQVFPAVTEMPGGVKRGQQHDAPQPGKLLAACKTVFPPMLCPIK